MEVQDLPKKIDIKSKDPENMKNLIENITLENNNFLQKTEYRDKFDGSRLYNRQGPSKVYVSKRAGDESDFWSGGKFCYDDPILRKELIYLPNNRESYCKKEIPPQFKNKEHNRTVTRISEYSNAKYNGGVFLNPQFLSC
jgi:hypothetical protein